jgi:hypothetical protein
MTYPVLPIGKLLKVKEGRFIRIEAILSGPMETFYLIRWTDTNEIFCEFPDKINELLR